MNPPFPAKEEPSALLIFWRVCPLARIADESPWSVHPFLDEEPPSEDLAASVRRFGILQPPLVMAAADDTFAVLSGLRRLRALRQAGGQETLCRVLEAGTDKRALLLLICEEHRWHSSLTVVEKAFLLALAGRLLPPDGSPAELYSLLSLRNQTREAAKPQTAKLLALAGLPPEILRAAHDGLISAATAQTLAALSSEDQQAIFVSLRQIPLGDNRQKRFLQLLGEAGGLRQETFAALLRLPAITGIISDAQMNPPQKGQRLLDALAALAAPESSEAERRFRQWQSTLALPTGAHIEHSPAFENDALRLILPFAGQEALEAFWQRIRGERQQTAEPAP
jgi:ParB-like chromosome segregation protein Spo0J